MTLLEQAKSRPVKVYKSGASEEEIELALAWLARTITSTQAASALGTKSTSMGNMMTRLVRAAYDRGRLQEVKP
jgi:Arc/MetJ family transcription regulator